MSFAEGVTTSQQLYKYNGKVLDTERVLNLYDYSARLMDPALVRFTTMDPLAEKHYYCSPHNYWANNPVKYIDPDGKEWTYFTNAKGHTTINVALNFSISGNLQLLKYMPIKKLFRPNLTILYFLPLQQAPIL